MNPSTPNRPVPNNVCGFDSLDSPIFISDEPGDNTVRPASPESLKRFAAERARLAKLGFNLDGTPIKPPPETDAK
jgi:hypothetical protein